MIKIKKNILLLLLISLMIFIPSVKADMLLANTPSSNPYIENYSNYGYYTTGVSGVRYLKNISVFSVVSGSDGETQQAYCVEPGVHLSYGGVDSTESISDYFSSNQTLLLRYILTYAQKLPTKGTMSEWKAQVKALSVDQYYKTLAAQALVWEVVSGERTELATHQPDNDIDNSLFRLIYSMRDNETQGIWEEYHGIIDKIRFSFLQAPDSFNLGSQAITKSMSWNGSSYSLTLHDSNNAFQYFRVSSTTQGVSADISGDGSTITITSSKAITEDNPAQIEISAGTDSQSVPIVFKSSTFQNLINVDTTSISYYLKVDTPNYQLKIKKVSSLNSKSLSGVSFKVCSDSSCSKVLGTIKTDTNGEAIYDSIPAPGNYYVQEIGAVAGYETNPTPVQIYVSRSNITGTSSYATKTITNTNKIFNLTKVTIDKDKKETILSDGCGTDTYTGPEFEIKTTSGDNLYFTEISQGVYDLATKSTKNAVSKLKTCNGKFKVYTLTSCNYVISEVTAPQGLTLPSNPTRSVDVCRNDANVQYTNGFVGLEFQKKDEEGNFIPGGKFALQLKKDNVYKDVLLKQNQEGSYSYSSNLKETDTGATYILLTSNGIARIEDLPPGEYRVVEKEAPDGYEAIKDKDSTAIVTIKDTDKENYYYITEMIDKKINKNGSSSSAELIVAINTGRKVINYYLLIPSLVVLLIAVIIIRKKIKK